MKAKKIDYNINDEGGFIRNALSIYPNAICFIMDIRNNDIPTPHERIEIYDKGYIVICVDSLHHPYKNQLLIPYVRLFVIPD